jgi:hypothetical protein
MIYYVIYFVLSFFALINVYSRNKIIIIFNAVLAACILILFAGLRFNVGFDYYNYELYYNAVVNSNKIFVEPLVKAFIYLCDYLNTGYVGFLFIMALVSISIKFKFVIAYSAIPLLSILLYYSRIFIISDFGQIRQGLALGLILFTYKPIIERRFKQFLLIVICSCLIHSAAIIFLPIYFVVEKEIQPRYMFLIMLTAIPVATINLKSVIIQMFSTLLPGGLVDKLMFYSENEQFIGLTFSMFLRGVIVLLCITVYWRNIKDNKQWLVIFNIYYWGYIFYLIFNSIPQLGGRGSLYFQQFEILLLPIIIICTKNAICQLLIVLFFIFYSFWGLSSTINFQDQFIPYRNLFENDSN